jgi:hypothetical protein
MSCLPDRDVALAALRSYEVAPQRVKLAAASFNALLSFNALFRSTGASKPARTAAPPARRPDQGCGRSRIVRRRVPA